MQYDDAIIMFSPHGLYDGGMRRLQRLLLLWRIGREQGHICCHNWHDVAGVGDGNIIVQGGYSLALDDLEVLPPWKELLVCNNIMGGVFDMGHAKGWIYELARAYLHGPIALSLWSRNLLMECS